MTVKRECNSRGRWWLLGTGVVLALAAALALIAAEGRASLAAGGLIYVDADATGEPDGNSWETAYTDLPDALDNAVAGNEVLVATVVCTPTWRFDAGDERSATFQMKNELAIYGGFDPDVGDEERVDRDWAGRLLSSAPVACRSTQSSPAAESTPTVYQVRAAWQVPEHTCGHDHDTITQALDEASVPALA